MIFNTKQQNYKICDFSPLKLFKDIKEVNRFIKYGLLKHTVRHHTPNGKIVFESKALTVYDQENECMEFVKQCYNMKEFRDSALFIVLEWTTTQFFVP